jgi:hypothetical protein
MRTASSLENTPRAVALAIAFLGVLALRAVAAGALDRFDRAELAALALFGLAFGVLTVLVDPGLRAMVRSAARSVRVLPAPARETA